jgi:hypothetical protein
MFYLPHTSASMLMRGNALVFEKHLLKMPREPTLRNTCHGPRTFLPHRDFHPTDRDPCSNSSACTCACCFATRMRQKSRACRLSCSLATTAYAPASCARMASGGGGGSAGSLDMRWLCFIRRRRGRTRVGVRAVIGLFIKRFARHLALVKQVLELMLLEQGPRAGAEGVIRVVRVRVRVVRVRDVNVVRVRVPVVRVRVIRVRV